MKAASIRESAARKLQRIVRGYLTRKRISELALQLYEREFDLQFHRYFYYNPLTHRSTWEVPLLLQPLARQLQEQEKYCSLNIQKLARRWLARTRLRKIIAQRYERLYDGKEQVFYYHDKRKNATFFELSPFLQRFQTAIPTREDDMQLYLAQQEIKRLKAEMQEKEHEIAVLRSPVRGMDDASSVAMRSVSLEQARSKQMDEWTTEQLCGWFRELNLAEHVDALQKHKLDGLIFLNLNEDDWTDLGITNKVQRKKLQLLMRSFRARFINKKKHVLDDDELVSEYAASELSEILAREFADEDSEEEEEDGGFEDEASEFGQLNRLAETREQRLERLKDERNIKIDRVVEGDSKNYPNYGDIVRVRYSILFEDGTVIASTKTHNDGTPLEYVLGCKQVCKGFERGMLQVSVGERARITVQPAYAYGEEGLPPTIPGNAVLVFDVTLLSFRTRAVWTKPYLQSPGLSQHPYTELHQDFLSIPNASSVVSLTNEAGLMTSARSTTSRSTAKVR